MFSAKHPTKSVIKIDDTSVSYVTLGKDKQGFFVKQHELIILPEDTIHDGEILRVNILISVLKKIAKNINHRDIDLVLPHGLFSCHQELLPKKKKTSTLKDQTCESDIYKVDAKQVIFSRCLNKDLKEAYTHILKKAGFGISTITSSLLSFDYVLPKKPSLLIKVSDDDITVGEFTSGIYLSYDPFSQSYNTFIADIEKNMGIDTDTARDIFYQYGFLRAHKEEKVYKQLLHSLNPLVIGLEKKISKLLKNENNQPDIFVVFENKPIPGFIDYLVKRLQIGITHLDIIETDDFHEILNLHRDESYHYQSHIAQALRYWKSV